MDKRKDASYRLVLARLSAAYPATIGPNGDTPQYRDVLVWAVISHHVAEVAAGGGAAAGSATESTTSCSFTDGIDATDATSGQHLSAWTWGPNS